MTTTTPAHVAAQATAPAHVAAQATAPGVLTDRARLTLIGLFGSSTTPAALLMTPSGKTLRVAMGDVTPGGTVVGIDATSVVLQSGTRQTRLTMPD